MFDCEVTTKGCRIREIYLKYSIIESKASKKAAELDEKKVYNDYYEYAEKVEKMPSHRILALNRGEKEDILTVHLRLEDSDRERIESMILREFPKNDLVTTSTGGVEVYPYLIHTANHCSIKFLLE